LSKGKEVMTNLKGLKILINDLLNESNEQRKGLLKEDNNLIRKFIRVCINEVTTEIESVNKKVESIQIVVKNLLNESVAVGGSPEAPSDITAINFLKNLLKNIIPSIEDNYKELTSTKKQRISFRKHILNATENLLNSLDADPEVLDDTDLEEVVVKIASDEESPSQDKPEGFIDIYDDEPDKPDKAGDDEDLDPEEEFARGLEDMDLDKTGRNSAFEAFKKVQNQIENEYSKLDPDALVDGREETERDIFRDYLLLNLKLYFDKFEEDLSVEPEEPETPSEDEYVSKKTKSDDLIPPEEAA